MTSRIKIFIIAFFLSLPVWTGINFLQPSVENILYAQISQIPETSFVRIPRDLQKPKLNLNVKSALSVKFKAKDGQNSEFILFEKDKERILPIASLTKLMTALLVLENTQDYDFSKTASISKTAASQDDVPIYGNLKAGENFKIKKLLDLMLIYSSNDAAYALAEVMGLEAFVEKMNFKAKELNLSNTHYTNPTGLDPKDRGFATSSPSFNYSTVQDLTTLANYILKNHSLIFDISSNGGPYPTHNGISEITVPDDFIILGGKTGNTEEAKGCLLVILASMKGETYINIILGAEGVKERVQEMQKLINWMTEAKR